MRSNLKSLSLLAVFGSLICLSQAYALPFNQDMAGRQPVTGQIMRPKDPNSVPLNSVANRIENRQEAEKLQNPMPTNQLSIANGKRLFEANCTACHGNWKEGQYVPSTLPAGMPSMNLALPLYKSRTDGYIFGTIYYGSYSTLMPGYGWKFSREEHWDLVNYIRKVQSEIN